jgi:hypothetical protein
MYRLETLNFTETEVLWNEYPVILNRLVLKASVYMGLLCVFLSGMQNTHFMFEDGQSTPDKFSAGYDITVLLTFFVGELLPSCASTSRWSLATSRRARASAKSTRRTTECSSLC